MAWKKPLEGQKHAVFTESLSVKPFDIESRPSSNNFRLLAEIPSHQQQIVNYVAKMTYGNLDTPPMLAKILSTKYLGR